MATHCRRHFFRLKFARGLQKNYMAYEHEIWDIRISLLTQRYKKIWVKNFQLNPEIWLLNVDHAVLARAFGVHSTAFVIESETKSVKHFLFINMSFMGFRLISKKEEFCLHTFLQKCLKIMKLFTKYVVMFEKKLERKTRRRSIEDIIINKKIPKDLEWTPNALAKTAWSTLSTQISGLRRNFETKFFCMVEIIKKYKCLKFHVRMPYTFLQSTRKVQYLITTLKTLEVVIQ